VRMPAERSSAVRSMISRRENCRQQPTTELVSQLPQRRPGHKQSQDLEK
jgi:hypothetical protein